MPDGVCRGQNGTHDLKDCIHKLFVQRSMLEHQAKIEGTIKQIEDGVWVEVRANLTPLHRLPQQSACLEPPWFDPMGLEGFQYFWFRLSRANHRDDNLAEWAAEY